MDSNIKTFGGLGSLFMVLSAIPYVGGVLGLIGLILLAIAVKRFSDSQGKPELFNLFLKGLIIYVVGLVVGIVFGISSIMTVAQQEGANILTYLLAGLGFLIVYGAGIIGSYFLKNTFSEFALITANNLFDWAGKLLFWGAILTVILIGPIISWLGWIILTVAFFTTQES